nr:unnamed protein product [Callosobruchus analis]
MDRAIAEMIALQNLPLHFVEGTGFRRVMQAALPKYKLRGRDFFSSYVCDNLYNKLAKKTKDLLEEFDKLSFTSDIWSEPHSAVSLLSLTAHGVSKDFRKKRFLKNGALIAKKFTAWFVIVDPTWLEQCSCQALRISVAQYTRFSCAYEQVLNLKSGSYNLLLN